MRGKAWDAAKQRQQTGAIVRPRPVVTLFVGKGHPLIPFVLDVA